MKKSVIKFFDKIILLLLGLSGIFYCCAKYGMPETEYEIKGVVTDKTNNKPIEGIRIINEKRYDNNEDTLYTNAEGKFDFDFYDFLYETPVHLKIEDVDGEENGGYFGTQEINVNFTDADLVRKAKGNKRGEKFVKRINVKLTKS